MYVCVCHALRERDVLEAIATGCHSMAEVHQCFGVETQCGRCQPAIEARIEDAAVQPVARAA